MKRLISVVFLLIQILFELHAQSYEELGDIFVHSAYTLSRNQVKYTQPADFDLVRSGKDYLECFHSEKYTSFNPASLTIFVDKLISKDKNFVVFIEIPPVFSRDSVYIDADLLPDLKQEINTSHCKDIRFDFRWNTGQNLSLDQCPISYKSSDYARSAFNADTVLTYPLKMWKKYENKYNNCQVMVIQKNTRGYICLYIFYNNEGKKNFEHYMKSLNGVFWYRDPKDYIEFVEPKQDSIIYIGHRKEVDARVYYSAHNEITLELMNFRYEEIVSLLDRGSFIKFYKADELYKLDKIKKYELVATDSMYVLAKIASGKVYLLKYKVDAPDYQKVYLQMEYSRNFVSPPADCDWKCYTDTFNILPYRSRRTRLDENMIVRKEKLSGEHVYDKLERMPEFSGGEQALLHYLAEQTSVYASSHEQEYLCVRVIVEKDGEVTHPYFILDRNPLGKNPFFRKAVLEIIKKMPKWKPGLRNGKAVRSYYTIPIMFKLK